jgi:nucleoside-diphosphate-sugar epimerase
MTNELLVVGATGVVGRNMLRHFEELPSWKLTGLSRRDPKFETRARLLTVDLQSTESCEAVAAQLTGITHVIYCATYEKENLLAGWVQADHADTNVAMLRNFMAPLLRHANGLQRILLLQGTKAYGAAAGTFKLPAKEDDPRYLAPNFYYGQEDYIRAAQEGAAWTWTALRPQFVCGFALGSPMNGLSGLAIYAAISHELGLPLRFPGGLSRIQEATDSRLLAAAAEWALMTPGCAGEIFNIVNGDCFTWDSLWPKIARAFGMEVAPNAPARLSRIMPSKADVWQRIVERHGLRPHSLQDLVPNWGMVDYLLGYRTPAEPMILSGLKARKFGFNGFIDSEQMFLEWIGLLQADRIIPS